MTDYKVIFDEVFEKCYVGEEFDEIITKFMIHNDTIKFSVDLLDTTRDVEVKICGEREFRVTNEKVINVKDKSFREILEDLFKELYDIFNKNVEYYSSMETPLTTPGVRNFAGKRITTWNSFTGSGLYKKLTNERMLFKDIRVKMDFRDTHAVTTSTQVFENDSDDHFEVVYKFTTSVTESVFKVHAKFIDTVTKKETFMKSRIYEKEKALEKYDDVISDGRTAALIEKENRGVYSLSLGNLSPKTICEVSIHTISDVKIMKSPQDQSITNFTSTYPSLYDDEKRKNIKTQISRIEVFFRLTCSDAEIVEMKSTSHNLTVEERGSTCWVGSAESVGMTNDFEVYVNVRNYPDAVWFRSVDSEQQTEEESEGEVQPKPQEFMMDLISFQLSEKEEYVCESTSEEDDDDRLYMEIIFTADLSGSMSGTRIKRAVESMKLCFQSLDPDLEIYFNIVSFGTRYKFFYTNNQNQSKKLDEESYREVMDFLGGMKADMGGTDILSPLQEVLLAPIHNTCQRRVIFLMTDGEDGQTNKILRCVEKFSSNTKIYSFGIGNAIDDVLLKGVADLSGGKSVFIREDDQIHESVLKILNVSLEPDISSLKILMKNDQQQQQKDVEKSIIFVQNSMSGKGIESNSKCFAWLKGGILDEEPTALEIHYTIKKKKYKQVLPKYLPIPRISSMGGQGEGMIGDWERMYAKRRIFEASPRSSEMAPELIDLAIRYEILTRGTAFLMESEDKEEDNIKPISGEMRIARLYTPHLRVNTTFDDADSDDEYCDDCVDCDDSGSDDDLCFDMAPSDGCSSFSVGSTFSGGGERRQQQQQQQPVKNLVDVLLRANMKGYWNIDDIEVVKYMKFGHQVEILDAFMTSTSSSGIEKDITTDVNLRQHFWITLLMIEYLRKYHSKEEIKWKLIVQKCVRNLKKEGVYDSLIKFAKDVISKK